MCYPFGSATLEIESGKFREGKQINNEEQLQRKRQCQGKGREDGKIYSRVKVGLFILILYGERERGKRMVYNWLFFHFDFNYL